jgi:hypothetical protein
MSVNSLILKKLSQSTTSHLGVLREAFVINAIEHYSKQVLADTSDWGNSLINQDAWKECASECLEVIQSQHGEQ